MNKHLLLIMLGFGSIQHVYSEDLISIMDFLESPEAQEMETAEQTLFAVEKCSALTFISIGGDNPDEEDVGDVFLQYAFQERLDAEHRAAEQKSSSAPQFGQQRKASLTAGGTTGPAVALFSVSA